MERAGLVASRGSRGVLLLKLKPAAEPRHGHSVIALLHRLFFP